MVCILGVSGGRSGPRRLSFLLLIPEGVFLVVSPLTGQGLGIMAISKRTKIIYTHRLVRYIADILLLVLNMG